MHSEDIFYCPKYETYTILVWCLEEYALTNGCPQVARTKCYKCKFGRKIRKIYSETPANKWIRFEINNKGEVFTYIDNERIKF